MNLVKSGKLAVLPEIEGECVLESVMSVAYRSYITDYRPKLILSVVNVIIDDTAVTHARCKHLVLNNKH